MVTPVFLLDVGHHRLQRVNPRLAVLGDPDRLGLRSANRQPKDGGYACEDGLPHHVFLPLDFYGDLDPVAPMNVHVFTTAASPAKL